MKNVRNARCAHESVDVLIFQTIMVALSGFFRVTAPAVGMNTTEKESVEKNSRL